jgi:hypothetical protein
MNHKPGWAAVALAATITLSPLPSHADNPKAILGKTIQLHYKKSIKSITQGLFVPTEEIGTTIVRHHLRFSANGDMAFVDLSTAASAFDRDHGIIYKLGQDMNFLANPERVDQSRFKDENFTYWIGGAALERNILSVTGRVRYVEKKKGIEHISDAKLTIAISTDGRKCEIKSMTQRISSERLGLKSTTEVSLLSIRCHVGYEVRLSWRR